MLNTSDYLALKFRELELLQRSRIAFDAIDEGVIITDREGTVVFLNDKMNKYLSVGEKIDLIFMNHSIDEIIRYGRGYEKQRGGKPGMDGRRKNVHFGKADLRK